MRIISGELRGRTFDSPPGHRTHPMSEKARGGLFNTLGDIDNLTVLDAYTGSGALSFEAVSRGASQAVAIDIDKGAVTTVVNNAKALGMTNKIKPIRANVSGWMQTDTNSRFDIVLADPPYDKIQKPLLINIAARAKTGGVIVYSLPPKTELDLPSLNYELLTANSYGDAKLVFYRRLQ